ncbi:PAS domain-containing sensor histidine kinase [uncultured Clostridium sp.]|uniref:sensor histidine kinase n=1 Tax=uncultured Clostridium sp. TaxID=59620 RepID=UPI0025F4A265|nr:PAS domain-containing sensor histidine kinase [uncultured Clostridium sp.]
MSVNKINKRNYTIEDLEELLDKIPYEIFIKDTNGIYQYVNLATEKKLGIKKEEIIGKNDYDIRPKTLAHICDESDKSVLENGDKEFVEDKIINDNIETRYEIFKALLNNDKDKVKIGGIAKFISEDKSLQISINENSNKIMNNPKMLNSSSVYYGILKDLKSAVKCNEVGLYLYDKNKNAMILNNHFGEDEAFFEESYNITMDIEKNYFYNYECKIEEKLNFNSVKYIYLLKINNNLLGCIHIYYENKPKKINEEFIKYICIILSFIKDKKNLKHAVEIESLKTEFFANLSHEFKTPLNIILSTVQLVMNYIEVNNEYPDYNMFNKCLSNIKQNSYRILKIANNLIDMSKIDGNFYSINMGNYNIVEVVENIVQSLAEYMKDNKRNIIFDTIEEEIITACDPDQIERIILNVLSNAMKFTSHGGNIYVDMEVNYRCNKVIIKISNDGEKINFEDRLRIFERFTQSESLLTRRAEGTGIGLTLVKSLVKLHNGEVYVNTEFEEGTQFCIELPIRKMKNFKNNNVREKSIVSKVEKFNIEFSDIYN